MMPRPRRQDSGGELELDVRARPGHLPSPVRAVLFDVGGTLLRVEGGVGTVYSRVARRYGVDVAPDELDGRFRTAWKRSRDRLRRRNYACSEDILQAEWRQIVGECFTSTPRATVDRVYEELYGEFATRAAWTVAPHARETLSLLCSRGVRLGILSNWDSRLDALLVDLALDSYFSFRVVSHAAGVEKPHPELFRSAVKLGGAPPAATLMVGDSWEADIEPARNLGLQTLWVRPQATSQHRTAAQLEGYPQDPESFWARWLTTDVAGMTP